MSSSRGRLSGSAAPLRPILAAALAALAAAGTAPSVRAHGAKDDERKPSVEVRLLRILKDRGVLSASEYEELIGLGDQMRREELLTSASFERELAALSERLEHRSAAQSQPAEVRLSYKHGDGVTVASGDRFAFTIGGREQIRFTYLAPDGKTSAGQDDRASFDIRRAKIYLKGFAVAKELTYQLTVDPTSVTGNTVRDAYLDFQIDPALHLRGGLQKRPFSRQNWTSSGDLQFVDRVSVVERFRGLGIGDRDVGAMAWGTLGANSLLEWYAGLFNGDGMNNGAPAAVGIGPNAGGLNVSNSSNNDSSGLEAIGRVVLNVNGAPGYSESDVAMSQDPRAAIALQYSFNPERRGNPLGIMGIPTGVLPTYDIHTFGADVAFKYEGLFFTSEAYYREIRPSGRLDDALVFNTATETGWFVQGGKFFAVDREKGPEVAIRYGQIDFDQNIAPAAPIGGTTKIDDLSAAFSYYFAGHALKLQLAYTYRVERLHGLGQHNEHQILQVQAQLKF